MPAPKGKEERVVFAVAPEGTGDGTGPVVLLGVSNAANEFMQNGMAHNFDLSSLGVPVKLILFGAPTYDDVMSHMRKLMEASKTRAVDMTNRDFSIKGT